jgi:hypothetical protein
VAVVVGLDTSQVRMAPLHLAPRRRRRRGRRPAGRAPPPPASTGGPGRSRRRRRAPAATAAAATAGVLEVDLLAELEPAELVVPAAPAASGRHCGVTVSWERGDYECSGGGGGSRFSAPLFSSLARERREERERGGEGRTGRNKSGSFALKITLLCPVFLLSLLTVVRVTV